MDTFTKFGKAHPASSFLLSTVSITSFYRPFARLKKSLPMEYLSSTLSLTSGSFSGDLSKLNQSNMLASDTEWHGGSKWSVWKRLQIKCLFHAPACVSLSFLFVFHFTECLTGQNIWLSSSPGVLATVQACVCVCVFMCCLLCLSAPLIRRLFRFLHLLTSLSFLSISSILLDTPSSARCNRFPYQIPC